MFKRRHKVVTLLINEDICSGCGNCMIRCRRKVINLVHDKDHTYAVVNFNENCKGCGHCLKVCPSNAIELIRQY